MKKKSLFVKFFFVPIINTWLIRFLVKLISLSQVVLWYWLAINIAYASDCVNTANITSLGEGVYIRQGQNGQIFNDENIANIGFIVGEKAVAVIDTGGSKKEGEALLCAIRQQTTLPIKYVINTHVHPDHILGNSAFRSPDTEFVGHVNLTRAIALLGSTYLERAQVQDKNMNIKDIIAPTQSVQDSLTLDLGERTLRISAIAQAHSDTDLSILDEQTNTLWLGDLLFVEHIPVMGGSGSVNAWLNLLQQLPLQQYDTFIAGHGSAIVKDKAPFDAETQYLSRMREAVRTWITEDKPLAQAITQIGKQEAQKWPMAATYHQRNISYLYAELEWE